MGQDGIHACGTRLYPSMWGKIVSMYVGQDGTVKRYLDKTGLLREISTRRDC